jgi:F420-non-reducing hydrogenase small subunit
MKPKFAMYWAAACGGCEIAVLNTHEKILDVDKAFDVVFWPVAMDAKYKDVESMQDGEILLTLFNGAIRTDENEHMAHLLRQKSKLLVAFGACANEGGIPGLANLSTQAEIFETVYSTPSTDNPERVRPQFAFEVPEGNLTIPVFSPVLRPLDAVVDVDYYIPGCPPESHQIAAVIDAVIAVVEGRAELPPKGSILGVGNSTVCDECKRTRNVKQIRNFVRIQDLPEIDPALCLLEQGLVCNGPATVSGCGALCPAAGAPCAGCYGAVPGVLDVGARMISSLASIVDEHDPRKIDIVLDDLADPTGVFYRFGLAGSLLQTGKASWNGS